MSHFINVPHRSTSESLVVTAAHARHLPTDDDRAVARQIALEALADGTAATAGELIDHIGGLEPEGRRAMLDAARVECGLPTIAAVEAEERWAAQQGGGLRASAVFTVCHAAGCEALATRNGALIRPNVKRWFCSQHEHLASAEDLAPRGLGLRALPGGGYAMEDDPEAAAQEASATSRQAQREAHEATRAAEADARERHQEAMRRQRERELPAHLRGAR